MIFEFSKRLDGKKLFLIFEIFIDHKIVNTESVAALISHLYETAFQFFFETFVSDGSLIESVKRLRMSK